MRIVRTYKTYPSRPNNVEITPPNPRAELVNVKFGWITVSSAEERAGVDRWFVEAYWKTEA